MLHHLSFALGALAPVLTLDVRCPPTVEQLLLYTNGPLGPLVMPMGIGPPVLGLTGLDTLPFSDKSDLEILRSYNITGFVLGSPS